MKKIGLKLGMGAVMAAACMALTSIPAIGTEEVQPSTSLAGLSLVLDQYYAVTVTADDNIISYLSAEDVEPETEEETEETTEAEETVEETTAETEESTESATDSYYDSIAIANVEDGGYVNVRTGAGTDYDIVGKIYNHCAATILDTVDGEDGEWYQIQSGSVTGYIKSEFFLTGEDAEAVARSVGRVKATVNSDCLRVRAEMSLADTVQIYTALVLGSQVTVLEEYDEWSLIQVDDDITGYVYNECIDIYVEFDQAVSLEEEQAAAEEEAARQAEYEAAMAAYEQEQAAIQAQAEAEAAAQALAEAAAAQAQADAAAQAQAEAAALAQAEAAAQAQAQAAAATQTADTETSSLRSAIVAYALQYVGNPYVYGGTSLTGGIDCSGFTMQVYANFGYGLSHYSGSQINEGTQISLDQLQPGDLVFYNACDGGPITHVAMYIGNGQIVHAANENYGICVWNLYYRTPCGACRILPD